MDDLNDNLPTISGSSTRYELALATSLHLQDIVDGPPAPIAEATEQRLDAVIVELRELWVASLETLLMYLHV